MNQPGSLNVMPIGYDTVFAHPIIIKKELQMSGLLVQYLICEKLYQVTKLLLKNGVFPHAIEICVRLQNVQMGIHGLAFILILVTETHIGNIVPITS